MGRGKEFFRGMTKTRLKEVIREEIAAVDFGQEFESSLIADLILQKHYHCAAQRLRPSLFRKLHRHGAAYDFSKATFQPMAGTGSHGRNASTLEMKWPGWIARSGMPLTL